MAFKPIKREKKKYPDIESVFYELPSRRIESLFSHQADILRNYEKNAINERNVAIELPTGSGKSLVGLMIGEFRRNNYGERIVYLCPTRQLVHQVVHQSNNKYGIKAIGFVGRKDEYSASDKSAFRNSEAIAVTNYSSLFNINPF